MNTSITRVIDTAWADAITHAPWSATGFELTLLLDRDSFRLLRLESAPHDWTLSHDGVMRYRGMPIYVVTSTDYKEKSAATVCEIVLRKA